MKLILDQSDRLRICKPTRWAMRVFTQGGLPELPGDAVTADLKENAEKRLEVSRSMPFERARENMIGNGRRPEFADRYLRAMLGGGETDASALELVREHAFKDRNGQIASDFSALPSSRSFRNAWRLSGQSVVIDMEEARVIFAREFIHWKIQREKELANQIEIHTVAGRPSDQLEAQFETLRAMNLKAMGDKVLKAKSPEALKKLCPECLR